MNKRIAEASALRRFFQEQLEYLQHLLESRRIDKLRQQTDAERLSQAVESIVDGTDARLRAVGRYQQRLRNSARQMLDYIQGLVAAVPPAMDVSRSAYTQDPLVNTIFRGSEDINRLFRQNETIQAFFNDFQNQLRQEAFALLLSNRKEKTILGAEIQKEMIVKDVRQTSISFYGHELIAPRETEDSARNAMKSMLFESVIQYLDKQITQLRYAQTEEEKLAGMLNPKQNINNPEVYLEMLVEKLSQPEKLIKLQDQLLRVSKMGIKLPLDSTAPSNKVRLYEVDIGDEASRVVTLVRFPRGELETHNTYI